jgi:rhodanese-related sulfurtransferase
MKNNTIIGLIGSLTIMLVISGIAIGGDMWPGTVDEKLAGTKESVKVVDMTSFRESYVEKDYDMIIDVREAEEYAEGHVTGAVNIPRGLIEFEIWKAIGYPEEADMKKEIYVYCKEGHRALLCTKTLQNLGFSNVTAVEMEIADWLKGGYPLEAMYWGLED